MKFTDFSGILIAISGIGCSLGIAKAISKTNETKIIITMCILPFVMFFVSFVFEKIIGKNYES